jgi:hypothetical protein
MRVAPTFVLFFLAVPAGHAAFAPAVAAAAPQATLVDRIVARVEDDIITLSEVRELAAYQELIDGQSEPDARLIQELIEQWAIRNESQSAQFPEPSETDVNAELQKIEARFEDPQAYAQRLVALDLTPDSLRQIVSRQIYLTSYIDYRFRPAVQVDDDAIAKYYQETLVPALKAKQQAVPSLDAVTPQIRELLTTQGINEMSAAWLEDTKSRLRIEIEPAATAGGAQP